MMTRRDERRFWKIVETCLVELLGKPAEEAHRKAWDAWEREDEASMLARDESGSTLTIYHAQPIHVASMIAGREIGDGEDLLKKYQQILARHEGGALRDKPSRKVAAFAVSEVA